MRLEINAGCWVRSAFGPVTILPLTEVRLENICRYALKPLEGAVSLSRKKVLPADCITNTFGSDLR
jgi:hypothetical protein